jgi:hypothetical protein
MKLRKTYEVTKMYEQVTKYIGYEDTKLRDSNYEEVTK